MYQSDDGCVESWRKHGTLTVAEAPLSSAASTTEGTWCTVHGSRTDPDGSNGQILYSLC